MVAVLVVEELGIQGLTGLRIEYVAAMYVISGKLSCTVTHLV